MYRFFLPMIKDIKPKTVIISILTFLFISLTILFIINQVVTASENSIRTKKVASVKIEAGDSLWSIAKRYITPEYSDIKQYIKEIKESNGITSDIIHENRYIIVPYYDFIHSSKSPWH